MELYQIKTDLPFIGYCETRIGGRQENQDYYGFSETPFGLLVTVCDGMGGGPAGKTASTIAVKEIIDGVVEAKKDNTPSNALLQAINRANLAILNAVEDNPKLKGMGTTCTAVLINEHSAIVAHVGDSRVYQLRGHHKVFRTFDHSKVFEMVKLNIITEEQARLSEESNIITRALGLSKDVKVDITERPYEKGDRFMLCSDGIHGTMPESELIKKVTTGNNLGLVVDRTATEIDELGFNKGGRHDNLTLAIIETKTHSILKEKMSTQNKIILIGVGALLALSCIFNITQCSRTRNSSKSIEETGKNDTTIVNVNGDTLIIKANAIRVIAKDGVECQFQIEQQQK